MTRQKQHRIYPPILACAREMRHPMTPAEAKLWARLRNRQLDGFKFRRQHAIDRFIVDFYCADGRFALRSVAIRTPSPIRQNTTRYAPSG